jgi:hypothetical protein
MTRGLLHLGLREANLVSHTRELSKERSAVIHESLAASFANGAAGGVNLWDTFSPPVRVWRGVSHSLEEALAFVQNDRGDPVLVLEEPWRDVIVVEVQWSAIRRLVTDAWYPSDDIYICDAGIHWCLVFTNYDTIHLYKRRN